MRSLSLAPPDFAELAAQILGSGHALRFQARGGSMHPFIRDGDVIEVEPVEASQIGLGDVIFCRVPGDRLVAHRVIRVSGEDGQVALMTRGDSAARFDQIVYAEQVLGRVVAIERRGKRTKPDEGVYGLLSVLWARLWPLSLWLYLILRKARHGTRQAVKRLRALSSLVHACQRGDRV